MHKNKTSRLIICFILLIGFYNSIYGEPDSRVKYSQVQIDLSAITLDGLGDLGITIDHHADNGNVYEGPVSQYELQILNANKVPYTILIEDVGKWYAERNQAAVKAEGLKKKGNVAKSYQPPENFHLGSMGGYLTFAEAVRELDEMRQLFPNLISAKFEIGRTVEDRPIWAVRVSDNPDVELDRPRVSYDALVHPREPMTLMNVIYYLWHLLEEYDKDPDIKTLVNSCEMYMLPVVNVDGYEYNRSTDPNGGGMWRKNRSRNSGGSRGVDLNRNYSTFWGETGSSGVQNSGTYRGTSAFSEPETQAYRDIHLDKNFVATINHHTYSNKLVHPYGVGGYPTNRAEYERWARELTSVTRWEFGPTPIVLGYAVAGAVKDWNHEVANEMSFVSELGSSSEGFWPTQNRIEPLAELILDMNLTLAREACPPITSVNMGRKYAPEFYADISAAGGRLNIQYQLSDEINPWTLTVLDLQGKQHQQIRLSASQTSVTFAQSEFPRSVYMLRIQTCNESGCKNVYDKKLTLGL